MRVESRGRARALQALYAWDVRPGQDLTSAVDQPTLVIASRKDRGVPMRHRPSVLS